MVVLKKADQIGGFLSYQETQPGVDITIRLLATRDEMQGQGLGQALLDWLIDFAVERKYSILRVGTQINNYTAIRLYQKRGFILTAARYRWHVWLAYQPVGLQLQRDRWE
jgi:ribosomal protein S18 acetylase RimI-like enzyme